MSKTVDERVVSMQFDNQQFEKNVKTSMSTLDKLKQSLNLKGASKGLDEVNAAAKRVDMSGIGNSTDTVKAKFSALQVMAVTALANIANSAVNTGKRLVSAFTLDPIMSGFSEYETQINAIQTILANTQSKGTTLDDVNEALDTLNTYADKTIYNFTEMTRNIGTFTAAGIDLDTSVNAIQGIANLAAVSGSNAQQASNAMYQLSQALASGTVKLQDWNSVVNSQMGGQVFQDALKETARVHGVAIDDMIKKEGTFRETLKNGWLTSEILTETLQKFTLTTEGLTDAQIQQNREMLKGKGYTDEQIDKIFELGKTATDAATKVKTFTQLMDTLKEAAQSGWTQTWELLVGDFEEAKSLFTELSDLFGKMISESANSRNSLLEGALTSNWDKLIKKINDAGVESSDFEKSLESALKDNGKDVEKLVEKYGSLEKACISGAVSSEILEKALGGIKKEAIDLSKIQGDLQKGSKGDDIKQAQKALKQLGYDLGEFGDNADGIDGIFGSVTQNAVKAFQAANKLNETGIIDKETLQALKDANSETKDLKEECKDLLDGLTKKGGRELLIDSFRNALNALLQVIKVVKIAWRGIFPKVTSEQLYGLIESIHNFSEKLKMSYDTANKVRRAFKGLFALLDIVRTIAGGGLKIAFKILSSILGITSDSVLDVAAAVGDAITSFRKWLLEDNLLVKGLKTAITTIQNWFKSFRKLPIVQNNIERLKNAFSGLGSKLGGHFQKAAKLFSEFVERVKELDGFTLENVGKALSDFWNNVIVPFFNFDGVFDNVGKAISQLGTDIWEALPEGAQNALKAIGGFFYSIKEWFSSIGSNISEFIENVKTMDGLTLDNVKKAFSDFWETVIKPAFNLESVVTFIKGLLEKFVGWITTAFENAKSGLGEFGESISNFFDGVKKKISNLNFGSIFTIALGSGIVYAFTKIGKLMDMLSKPLEAFKEIGKSIIGFFRGFQNALNAFAMKTKTEALKNVAISIAILVGSIIALAIAMSNEKYNVGGAFGLVSALVGELILVVLALTALEKWSGDLKTISMAGLVMAIGTAMLLIAWYAKIVSGIDQSGITKGVTIIAAFLILVAGLIAINSYYPSEIDTVSNIVLKVGIALLLIGVTVKIIAGISDEGLSKGLTVITALSNIILGLVLITQAAKESTIEQAGNFMLKVAGALAIMGLAIKIIGGTSYEGLFKGLIVITILSGIITGLVAISKLGGKYADKAGDLILKVSGAFSLIAIAIKIIAGISNEGLLKGIGVIAALGGIVTGLIAISKLGGKNADKAGTMIMRIGVAFLLIAASMAIISILDPKDIEKAIAAVAAIGGVFAGLIVVSKYSKNAKQTIIALSVAIAVLAIALAGLAMIDPKNLAAASASLSAVTMVFTGLLVSTKLINTGKKSFKRTIATLLVLSAVIVILAGVIAGLSTVKPERAIGAASAISILLLSLSGSMLIINKFSKTKPEKMFSTLMVLTGIVALLGIAIGALAHFTDPESAIASALALSTLLIALSTACLILSAVKSVSPAALGAVTVLGLIVVGLAFVLNYVSDMNPQGAIGTAIGLSTLILALSGACVLLSVAGLMGTAAIFGIVALVALIAAMGALIVGVGALVKEFPEIEEFIDTGIPILEKLAAGIGSILGSFVKAFASEVMDLIPRMGLCLSMFMANATPFIVGMKMVDVSVLAGISILTAAILELCAAQVISSVTKFMSFGQSFASLGAELSLFAISALPFISIANTIDPNSMKGVKALAEAILYITAGNLLDSITSWISGDKDLGTFGEKIVQFGRAMVNFSTVVSGNIDNEAVTAAANAGKVMASMVETIPGTGGVVQFFTGEHDFEGFSDQLVPFGKAIVRFSDIVAGRVDGDAVKAAASAGKIMAGMVETIPQSGGVVQFFTGEHDFKKFSNQLVPFGKAMVRFSDTVKGKIDSDAVKCAADAGKVMASLVKAIPETPGALVGLFTGTHDWEKFNDQIVPFGRAMVNFSKVVSKEGIDPTAIDTAYDAGLLMAKLADSMPETGGIFDIFTGGTATMEEFGEQLVAFGESIVSFSKTITDGGVDSKAVLNVGKGVKAIAQVGADYSEGIDFTKLTSSLSTFGYGLAGFYKIISDGVDLDELEKASTITRNIASAAYTMPDKADFAMLTNGLDEFGKALVSLSETVKGNLDSESLSIATTVGNDIAAIVSTISDAGDLTTLSKGMIGYGESLVQLSDTVKDGALDIEALGYTVKASEKIKEIAESIPETIDWDAYISNVPMLGGALKRFANTVDGVFTDENQFTNVGYAVTEINAMLKVLSDYSDVGDFIRDLPQVASAVVAFANTMNWHNINEEEILGYTEAGKAIGEFLETIPPATEYTDFIQNLAGVATSLVNFSNIVGDTFADADEMGNGMAQKAAYAGITICTFLDEINGNSGDYSSFISGLPMIAGAMVRFAKAFPDHDIDKEDIIEVSDAGKYIYENFLKNLTSDIDYKGFVDGLPKVADSINSFAEKMTGFTMPDLQYISSQFEILANTGIATFVTQFNSKVSDSKLAAYNFAYGAKSGIDSAKDGVVSAMWSVVSAAENQVSKYSVYNDFYTAGESCASGFANGIKSGIDLATNAGSELGDAALKAAKEAVDSNSPSKEFYKVGEYCGIGMSNALYDYRDKTYNAGYDMGDYARIGLTNAMSRIQRVIDNDIDSQPTIRPVLDLSNVTNGANAISGMLSMNPSIGAVSNIRAISTSMNRRIQNGTNNDVVSAIKDLGSRMGHTSGDTYQINGITYSSDSDVADAIKTLVRAARVERRV